MAKDEAKKEKKSKRKSEGNVSEVGEDTVMSIDAPVEKKVKKEKKEKKVKTEDGDDDDDLEEDAVSKGEVSPDAISPIARE
jgi:H/ACA ribonucleoprotein complex subunit 2